MTDRNTQVMPSCTTKVHSQVQGSIEDFSFLEQSLLFAELASLSYYDPGFVEAPLAGVGFSESQFFDRDGAQAWIFANEQDCIVCVPRDRAKRVE